MRKLVSWSLAYTKGGFLWLLVARHLQPLVSILTPIYWTTALELNDAVNGYSLTQGNFQRDTHVEFATGE